MAYYSYSNYDHQCDFNRSDYYSLNSNHCASYHPVQDPTAVYSDYNNSFNYQIYAYDPVPFSTDLNYIEHDQVQSSISYSVSEFNEDDFEEYDPTPYGGGYDLALTYGNALPPSDDICYPHSAAAPPNVPSTSPAGKSEPTASGRLNDVVAQQQGETGKGHEATSKPTASEVENDAVAREDEDEGSSGSRGEYGYGGAGQMPYGYGLEAMDICESLFGYWPCISRYRRKMGDCEQGVNSGNCSSPWDGTVDYLFGSTNPYEQRSDDGSSMYGYQMHHLHHQVVDDSWS